MLTRRFTLYALVIVALIVPASASAQAAGETAVEGYVFDARTLRPLSDAIVIVQQAFPDGLVASSGVQSDANGFYSTEFSAASPLLSSLVQVSCVTKKGIASSAITLYSVLQPIIYKRNVYLSLPRHQTACLPPG